MNDAPRRLEHPGLADDQARLFARLDELGAPVRTARHAPVYTVAQSRALRGDLAGGHCKSLFLRDKKGKQYLVVALEGRKVDMKTLRAPLGAKSLSFASAERLWETLRVRPGSVTPFALINADPAALSVALDKHMLDHDPLNYHPLSNDATTAISPGDLLRFVESCGFAPRIIDFETLRGA